MKNRNKNCTFEELDKFQKELPKGPNYRWVFRGEKRVPDNEALKTTLQKSFERFGLLNEEEMRLAEIDVIREFQRKLHLYMDNLPTRADICQWLAIMQHHGAPTRLLDWTYSYWIAVHFATTRRKPDELVRVWAINTKPIFDKQIKLEEKNQIDWDDKLTHKDLPYCDEDAVRDNQFLHSLFKETKAVPRVYAMTGFRLNQRITIQQGTFLIPGDITKSFYENLSDASAQDDIKKFVFFDFKVTKSLKLEIANNLGQMNISNAVLFPGLVGFSESLWKRVGIPLNDKLVLEKKYLSLWP